jgi:hypothetical protein
MSSCFSLRKIATGRVERVSLLRVARPSHVPAARC